MKELYQVHKDNDKQFQLQEYGKQTGALFTPTITRDFMAFMAKRIEMRNPTLEQSADIIDLSQNNVVLEKQVDGEFRMQNKSL